MITVDEKLTAIYGVLNADSTLRDASHLNGTGKIFKSPTRPAKHSGEALTMNLFPSAIEGQQPFMEIDFLRLVLYLPNMNDTTPKMNIASNIESRIGALLDEVDTVVSGKRYKTERDPGGRFFGLATETVNEHAWVFQYVMRSR